jgi:hypothetical protein
MTEDEFSRIENGAIAGEAILFMRSQPKNPDGTIGFIAKVDQSDAAATEAFWRWWSYFRSNGMARQLAVLESRAENGYMVPHADPRVFDPNWRPVRLDRKEPAKLASQMTREERQRVIERVSKINPLLAKFIARPDAVAAE